VHHGFLRGPEDQLEFVVRLERNRDASWWVVTQATLSKQRDAPTPMDFSSSDYNTLNNQSR